MTTHTAFTVRMHPELVDELDEGFSPMDGIQAINDIFVGLPLVHPSPVRNRRRLPKTLRLYTARFEWYSCLGISYVQISNQLHVVELWFDNNPERRPVDVVLPETEVEERPVTDYPTPPMMELAPDIFDGPTDTLFSEADLQKHGADE